MHNLYLYMDTDLSCCSWNPSLSRWGSRLRAHRQPAVSPWSSHPPSVRGAWRRGRACCRQALHHSLLDVCRCHGRWLLLCWATYKTSIRSHILVIDLLQLHSIYSIVQWVITSISQQAHIAFVVYRFPVWLLVLKFLLFLQPPESMGHLMIQK